MLLVELTAECTVGAEQFEVIGAIQDDNTVVLRTSQFNNLLIGVNKFLIEATIEAFEFL